MSRVTEMAEQEAARAEAEEPDAEEAAEEEELTPEPETPPEPEPQGPTPEQMAALDREDKRHEKALAQLMGADFSYFARCGNCDGLGYFMPPPPVDVKYREHPATFKCPTCDGMGDVLSGATGRNQLLQCPDCAGNGYKRHDAPQAAAPTITPATQSEDPMVAELRARGFTVVPPYVAPAGANANSSLATP